MKVCLLGNESTIKEQLSFLKNIPDVEIEKIQVENEEDAQNVSLPNEADLILLSVSEKWRSLLLDKIDKQKPVILVGTKSTNVISLKESIRAGADKWQMRISTLMMGSPELLHIKKQFQQKKLGKSGVHRISLKKHKHHPAYKGYSNEEIDLIHWTITTLGDYKTVFAKKVKDRYITVHIRLADDSFVQLELARGFGKDEMNIELTGSSGMFTHNSSDIVPIQMNRNDASSVDINPIGQPLSQRQLKAAFDIFLDNEGAFSNISEIEQTEKLLGAIELSIKQGTPVTNGGELVND